MTRPRTSRTPRNGFYGIDVLLWLARTAKMPLAAQGAYLRLLLHQWDDRDCLRSEADARALCGCQRAEWTRIWLQLAEHFPAGSDGILRNGYCERERQRVAELGGKRAEAGALGASKRVANAKQTASNTASNGTGLEMEIEIEHPSGVPPEAPRADRPPPLDLEARIDAAWAGHPAVDTPAIRRAFEALEANREARKRQDPRSAGRRGPESVRAWLGKWSPRGPDALLAMLTEAVAGGWQDVREPDPRPAAPRSAARPGGARAELLGMADDLPDYREVRAEVVA